MNLLLTAVGAAQDAKCVVNWNDGVKYASPGIGLNPETVIAFMDGGYLVVRETPEQIFELLKSDKG